MKAFKFSRWFRMLCEAVILFVVWRHSHWSVAAVLTALTIDTEVEALMWRELSKGLKELTEGFKK